MIPDEYFDEAAAAFAAAETVEAVAAVERQFAGRGSRISELKTAIKDLDAADRPAAGKAVGEGTARIAALAEARRAELAVAEAATAGSATASISPWAATAAPGGTSTS